MSSWPKQKMLFFGSAAFLLLMMLLWAPKAPINVDELLHNKQAKYVVAWYKTLGADQSAVQNRPDNLRYYGQSVDNLAALINDVFSIQNEYLTRHLAGAVFGWLLLLLTGLFTKKLSKSWVVGIFAMLLLFLSPRPFGQSIGNLKDLPFALGYLWSVYALILFIKELPRPSFRSSMLLAGSIAFTNSVRIGGLIFYFYIVLFVAFWFFNNRNKFNLSTLWAINKQQYLWHAVIFVVIGYFGSLLFWPYGLQNPITHPLKALTLMSDYSISIRQIFEGKLFWSTNLPIYYLPKWLLISLPEVTIVLAIMSIYSLVKKVKKHNSLRLSSPEFILLFAVLFPIVYVLLIDANLYSGWRQLYFIYPPLLVFVCVESYVIWQNIQRRKVKLLAAGVLAFLLVLPVYHSIKTFPNQYIYFNHSSRLLGETWSEYEYDYYFQGMKEASEWLLENEGPDAGSTIASNFDIRPYLPADQNLRYQYMHFYNYAFEAWDYAVLSNNYVHPFQLKNNNWKPAESIKTFYHNGNPYVVVLKRQNKQALTGKLAYDRSFYYKAVKHFERALRYDPKNIYIMAYLATAYAENNKFEEAEELIQRGLLVHPESEALYFAKAKMQYKQAQYDAALEIAEHLINLNPKHRSGLYLMANCYEKKNELEKANSIRNLLDK